MKKNLLHAISLAICLTLLLMNVCGCSKTTKAPKQESSNTASSKAPGEASDKDSKEPSETALADVTLNEVAHSIFYAPMYVAIEQGYFEEEGINLTLVTGFGADKTMTAVLSGEAEIGFMGPETTVYTYNEGSTDRVINFAQLTQRAGNFLVAREEMPDFSWSDLRGKEVLGGRKGGMPSHDVTWEHIRGIYEWTSRKSPDLKVFKYEEKVVSVS